MTEDKGGGSPSDQGDGDPKFASKEEQPAGSQVDDYARSYEEPDDASLTEPETRSGANVGTARWECLSCGETFTEDHGMCPNDGAPLRKAGVIAAPIAEWHADQEPRPMATRPDQTPEGYESEPATASKEPEQGDLQGERGSGV